ncbi:P-loop containing nucleoside triphosphate hydrolase protein [Dactylonectria estremocensis]|uniref:P-loop containing nucleoside triphosphate hydrolase protein n=1 Tax=Dactylonectria estremocensis TaxID=1079267 RepID=A0A9P9EW36_9HYPO|nr:P-loop containing nucleoside triphosphate hydrolase protein [Dactylonectria estremocensis]
MDVDNWQANRIRHSRYLQDGRVKPWPWGIQVQILGAEGCGRHSVLNRICLDQFVESYCVTSNCNSGCRQARIRGQPCSIWFDTPVSLTSHGEGYPLGPREHFSWLTRGIRDSDALILAYDVADPRSFQALCEFCARCELEGVGVAPGASLPCLVVGTKADRPSRVRVEDGQRLADRLGGGFVVCSAKDGRGFAELIEEAVGPVIEARTRLMRESEETLGVAIRHLMAGATARRPSLRKKLSVRRRAKDPEVRRPVTRARCTGAPPRWTMRRLLRPPPWGVTAGPGSESDESEVTLVEACPLEFQLPVDLVEPAATDWAPKF